MTEFYYLRGKFESSFISWSQESQERHREKEIKFVNDSQI